jgi:hypothetical protein
MSECACLISTEERTGVIATEMEPHCYYRLVKKYCFEPFGRNRAAHSFSNIQYERSSWNEKIPGSTFYTIAPSRSAELVRSFSK